LAPAARRGSNEPFYCRNHKLKELKILMKRFFVLFLALCMLLCACGQQPEPETLPPETTEPETTQTQTAPTVQPTQPETTTAAAPPVITKDPLGENLAPGSATYFTATAENYTILTWEFVSPDGAVYSVTETMSRHAGLMVDTSRDNRVDLSKVPLSLNGWSVQARFDGPGGSATTKSALITVTRSEGAYDAVISRYRAAMQDKSAASDVSEMIYYAAHAGYARQDLNGDGQEELIIAGIGYDDPDEPFLFEIFTLENGVPVSAARSQLQSRLFLMNDGKLLNESFGNVSGSSYGVMQLYGSQLRFLNGLYTVEDGQSNTAAWYFTTSNQYGDPAQAANDNFMEQKAAQAFLKGWRDAVCLPELSLIA